MKGPLMAQAVETNPEAADEENVPAAHPAEGGAHA